MQQVACDQLTHQVVGTETTLEQLPDALGVAFPDALEEGGRLQRVVRGQLGQPRAGERNQPKQRNTRTIT